MSKVVQWLNPRYPCNARAVAWQQRDGKWVATLEIYSNRATRVKYWQVSGEYEEPGAALEMARGIWEKMRV